MHIVVTIASTPVIRKHGMNAFLKPFVNNMQKLENEGLNISINGTNRHLVHML